MSGSDFGFEETEFYFRLAFVDFDGKKVIKFFQGEIDPDFIQKERPNIALGDASINTICKRSNGIWNGYVY